MVCSPSILSDHVSILFLSKDMPDICSEGEVRLGEYYLYNQKSYANGRFHNQTNFQIAYVKVCINGSFHVLCNENLSVETASALCSTSIGYSLGYPGPLYGSSSDYLLPESSNGVYNINCSGDSFSLNDCSFSIVADTSDGCDANGGPALVTCVDGKAFLL